jgi:hypothetical protein
VSILDDHRVLALLCEAWRESQPGTPAAHEEGGFVLRNEDGFLTVERWLRGGQRQISVPPHRGGLRRGLLVVATFHTHPNPGSDFQQEPSLTDIRAVRDDTDLDHADYEGEYVIASEHIYRISKHGLVETIGDTGAVLQIAGPETTRLSGGPDVHTHS